MLFKQEFCLCSSAADAVSDVADRRIICYIRQKSAAHSQRRHRLKADGYSTPRPAQRVWPEKAVPRSVQRMPMLLPPRTANLIVSVMTPYLGHK
jgi:hypothetical protein